MSRITVEQIQEELSKDGWKLKSIIYHNLDEELEFECANGHTVFSTWRAQRAKRNCPVCAENILYQNKDKIISKKPTNSKRIIGIDQATYLTGYSIWDSSELIKYGIFKTDLKDEIARDNKIKEWLINLVETYNPDLVGIEDIQLQQLGGGSNNVAGVTTYKVLAHLQGILMETLYALKIPYRICHQKTWRSYCGVKGRSRTDQKKSAQLLIQKWYDLKVSEDEADAICIGKFLSEN